jgi:hypothetical protein
MPETPLTPALAAAALYAGLNGLLLLWLSTRVVRERMRTRISLGDGGDPTLNAAIRAHGNATENAPMILLMLTLAAAAGAPAAAVHAGGAALTAGRALHALALLRPGAPSGLRAAGMAMTYGAGLLSAVALVSYALAAL